MITHGQSPEQSRVNPEWNNAILHARISIGDTELMAADIPNAEPMRSAYLTLRLDSEPQAERVFSALSDGGQVLMPMQETFFASRFGQVRDRFRHQLDDSPRASYAGARRFRFPSRLGRTDEQQEKDPLQTGTLTPKYRQAGQCSRDDCRRVNKGSRRSP